MRPSGSYPDDPLMSPNLEIAGLRGARVQAVFARSSNVAIGWSLWGMLPQQGTGASSLARAIMTIMKRLLSALACAAEPPERRRCGPCCNTPAPRRHAPKRVNRCDLAMVSANSRVRKSYTDEAATTETSSRAIAPLF